MVILAVDGQADRLRPLEEQLRQIFPKDTVLAETDPLMAGKYVFFHPVDLVLAELNMRRVDGLKIRDFVRYANAQARVYLMGSQDDFYDWDLLDEEGAICAPGLDGLLFRPITMEQLKSTLKIAPENGEARENGAQDACRSKPMEDLYAALEASAALKQQLVEAALEQRLAEFFREQGCNADMDEIQAFFRDRARQQGKLSDEQLQSVVGGANAEQDLSSFILTWAGSGRNRRT